MDFSLCKLVLNSAIEDGNDHWPIHAGPQTVPRERKCDQGLKRKGEGKEEFRQRRLRKEEKESKVLSQQGRSIDDP